MAFAGVAYRAQWQGRGDFTFGVQQELHKSEFWTWFADGDSLIALLLPLASVTAVTHLYLPSAIAILHYLEVQRVTAEVEGLRKDVEYLIDVREGELEALLTSR